MTPKQQSTTHRLLTNAGFRRGEKQGVPYFYMPWFPGPKLHIDKPLECFEDVIETVFWWGHCVGEERAREQARKALGL